MLKELEERIKEPEFYPRLQWAMDNYENSTDAKKIIDDIRKYLRKVGAKIKWLAHERDASKADQYALTYTYGPGTYFTTIAPKMSCQRLAVRFMRRERGKAKKDQQLPDLAERNALEIQNPVDCARAYEIIVRAFYKDVLRRSDAWRGSMAIVAEEDKQVSGRRRNGYLWEDNSSIQHHRNTGT